MIETGHRTDPLTQAVAFFAATYRSLPQSKLLGLLSDGRSRAQAGHRFAALLAAMGQGVEERAAGSAPRWRDLPFDGHFIVGDQIAVTGHDLVAGMRGLDDPDELVWSVEGRRVPAGDVLASAMAAAERLRALI